MKLNMFRAPRRPSSGAKNCTSSLWFCIILWKVVGCAIVGSCQAAYTLPDNVQQWHIWQPFTVLCKTRGCLCSFRLLMMGGVAPETCWASFKIGNNKILIHCCILLAFSVRNSTMMHGSTNIMLTFILLTVGILVLAHGLLKIYPLNLKG